MRTMCSIRNAAAALALLAGVACAAGGSSSPLSTTQRAGSGGAGASASDGGSDALTIAVGVGGSSSPCAAPDMLILLDRTLTMAHTPDGKHASDAPDYASTKWHQAATAINDVVSPPLDGSIRFGLELWPRDPGGGACQTLANEVAFPGGASNAACEVAEIVIPPALDAGADFDNILVPGSTTLCFSTPTGQALVDADNYLAATQEGGRDQYVMLVTDGADWEKTCPQPDPLALVQTLAAKGIRTFVVGFYDDTSSPTTAGVGEEFLNDLACAGGTAADLESTCQTDPNGHATAIDPSGPNLFLQAANTTELATAFQTAAASICCDCID